MAKDIMAKVGEYTNAQGETKGEWVKIGAILDNSNGQYVLIEPTVNLAGVMLKQRLMNPEKAGKTVIASVFDKESAAPKPQQPAPQAIDRFDDAPF